MEGRAVHLSKRMQAYLAWYRQTQDPWPTPLQLSAATDVMLAYMPADWRERNSMSPWVLDSEFEQLFRLTQQTVASLPAKFSTWPSHSGLASTVNAGDRS